jgi:hypothetical protein
MLQGLGRCGGCMPGRLALYTLTEEPVPPVRECTLISACF